MATEMQSPLPAGAGGRGRKASGERDTRRERAWAGQGRGEVGAGGGGKAWLLGWGKPPPERQARPQTPRVTIGFSVTPAALPASAGRAAGPGGLCPAPKGSIHPTKGPRGDLDPPTGRDQSPGASARGFRPHPTASAPPACRDSGITHQLAASTGTGRGPWGSAYLTASAPEKTFIEGAHTQSTCPPDGA